MKRSFTHQQRSTLIYGVLCMVLFLAVLQLWLLAATMNAYLGGDDSVIIPAAVASLCCFGCNAGLARSLYRIDDESSDAPPASPASRGNGE